MTNPSPRSAGRRRVGRRRQENPRDEGTSSVELVITMPALLLGVLVVIQFGLWMHAQHVASAAAQDGARVARAYDGSEVAARDRATASLDRLGRTILRDREVAVVRTARDVTVTVSGHVTSVIGVFALPVREQARGPVERFIPAAAGIR
jgi:Flp pilus assembly protein TadG